MFAAASRMALLVAFVPALEDGVVHDLVEEYGEVENREPLHEGQRNPDRRVREVDQRPRGRREDRNGGPPPQDGEPATCDGAAASARARSPSQAQP